MDESLREEVLDAAPLDSEEEFAELERRVICEAEILEVCYSTNGPHVCTYTPACTFAELDHWVIREAEILEGRYSTNSPHICTGIPICTYSYHAMPSDAQAAETRVELRVKEQPREPSAKHEKPKGQKKRKLKVNDVPRKRRRPDLQLCQGDTANLADLQHKANLPNLQHSASPAEPTNMTDLLHKADLPSPQYQASLVDPSNLADPASLASLQHQANLADTDSLADPASLVDLKHQAIHTDPSSLASMPLQANLADLASLVDLQHQANPVSYTSSSFSVPPTHRVIPANVIQYTRVVSLEQRERYLLDYRAAKNETDYLCKQIRWNLQHFTYLKEQLRFLVPGSKEFQEMCYLIQREFRNLVQLQPGFIYEMNRYLYLMSVMTQISQLIEEYDFFNNQSEV